MKKRITAAAAALAMLLPCIPYAAITSADDTSSQARVMEYLDRGTVAVKTGNGVYISWRLLGTENYSTTFDVYRGSTKIKDNLNITNCYDSGGSESSKYTVVPHGDSVSSGKAVSVWGSSCLTIPIEPPASYTESFGGTNYEFTYSANDASVIDVDGDGQYEIILKWDPSHSFDSGDTKHVGPSGKVYVDAYTLEGVKLWRIDLGNNISAGAHFTQIAAYDFDLDGKGEVAMKTAPGSIDGRGKFVSEASSISSIKNTTNNNTDYRSNNGRVLDGDEYYTVFDGQTGAALDTVYYPNPRGTLKDWGDTYGGRADRFLTTAAYLDGKTPSMIAWRGYYERTTAGAYNLVNKKLVQVANFDTKTYNGINADTAGGQGNHNTTVADVDGDGRDEILCGSLCLGYDESYTGDANNYHFVAEWSVNKGHGDASGIADYDPTHDGLEYFIVHEHEPYGMSVVYPEKGKVIYHADGKADTGRGIMARTNTNGYYQIWSTAGADYCEGGEIFGHYDENGSLSTKSPNFRIFWDGDVYDELWANTGSANTQIAIDKAGSRLTTIDTTLNNDTKANVCLQADLLGDWREELIGRNSDSTQLEIYISTTQTDEKLYTLMQNGAYRMQIVGQNSAYNQPPYVDYYLSPTNDDNDMRKFADYITTIHNGVTSVRTENISQGTIKEKVVRVTADADTYLTDSSTSHGTETEIMANHAKAMYTDEKNPGLKLEKNELGLIRFDLSDYKNEELISAQLQLYQRYSDTTTSTLHLDYCTQDNWNEATVTTADITVRGKGTPLTSLGLEKTPSYSTDYRAITFDVTDAIKADTDNVHTFTLWTGTAREQVFASKEYTGADAQGPTLVLTFKDNTVVSTPDPTASPTPSPTLEPTASPTPSPTLEPTASPTPSPTLEPTATPTSAPTSTPTLEPTSEPTSTPTLEPTSEPTPEPTAEPTSAPSPAPTPRDDVYINIISDTLSVTDGTLTGTVTAKLENYDGDAKLILAVYDKDGLLRSVQLKDADGETAFDNVEIENIESYKYAVYAWNDLNNMTYLCDAYDGE